eukprot:Partr_v1_DN24984_c0_g1_i4_m45251 putative phosphatidic acid phosphatase type
MLISMIMVRYSFYVECFLLTNTIVLLVSLILAFAVIGALELAPPFERFYFQSDDSISYPLLPETVPVWMCVVIAFVVPLAILAATSLFYKRTRFELHHAILAFFVALAFTTLLTQVMKVSAGRLRPNFLARCQPSSDKDNAPCKGDYLVVREGRKSFPSGHSSMAFSGLGFLALYLAGKLQVFNRSAYAWKFFVVLFPLIGAYLIAVSRVDDYYHHWQDVLVGGLIGAGSATFTYFQYFDGLSGHGCGKPRLNRLERSVSSEFTSGVSESGEQLNAISTTDRINGEISP